MPRDLNAPIVANPNPIFFGEEPKTRFLDWLDAIHVTILHESYAEAKFAMRVMQRMTWAHDYEDLIRRASEAELQSSLSGQTLPLNLEVPTWTFLIEGVSRIITHQIVRTRLGVVFSQRGTGDQDCRHDDVLVPRSLNRPDEVTNLEYYIHAALVAKNFYAGACDGYGAGLGGQSLVAMRYALPQSLAQMIVININLQALIGLVGKRLCTNETIEYNRVAEQMAACVVKSHPELAPYLKADCDKPSGCYYQKAFGKPFAGSVYVPDEKHDRGPWNPASYVYDTTRNEMLDGPPFQTREYAGYRRVR